MVADVRGPYSMLVWDNAGTIVGCIAGAQGTLMSGVTRVPQSQTLGPDSIVSVMSGYSSAESTGAAAESFLTGQAGAAVTAVTLDLTDGTSIEATVANGWFAAWWPGSSAVAHAGVTTPAGTLTQTLPVPGTNAPLHIPN